MTYKYGSVLFYYIYFILWHHRLVQLHSFSYNISKCHHKIPIKKINKSKMLHDCRGLYISTFIKNNKKIIFYVAVHTVFCKTIKTNRKYWMNDIYYKNKTGIYIVKSEHGFKSNLYWNEYVTIYNVPIGTIYN